MDLLLNSGIEFSTATLRPVGASTPATCPFDATALIDIAKHSRFRNVWISGTDPSRPRESRPQTAEPPTSRAAPTPHRDDPKARHDDPGSTSYDPAVIAGSLARVDPTMDLGIVGQLGEPPRSDYSGNSRESGGIRHPGLYARDISTLSLLTPRQVRLLLSCDPLRVRVDSDRTERARRLCEAVRICSLLLDGRESTLAGEYYSVKRASNKPALNRAARECLAVDLSSLDETGLGSSETSYREAIKLVINKVGDRVGLAVGSGDADVAIYASETLATRSHPDESPSPTLVWRLEWKRMSDDELVTTVIDLVDSGVAGFLFRVDQLTDSTLHDISALGSLIASIGDRLDRSGRSDRSGRFK